LSALAQASALSVALGGHTILRDVTVGIGRGEAVGLLGANGSGKSTLVKALLGLIPASGGSVELFGRPPGRLVPWAKVAYVPQDSPAGAGVPTSALEVVVAGQLTGPRPWPPRGAKGRALTALGRVGLRDRAHDAMGRLSTGQRHRVLLARALARRPELLIMDEPLAGIDASSATALVATLRETEGLTSLVVLHEPGPFAGYLTRGIVLEAGRVAADGPMHDVAPHLPAHHHHDDSGPRPAGAPSMRVRP
jgi:zinc transport system ATP-binding protein